MPSLNKVVLAGNITRAPELKYTPKGTAVCRVGLAVNRTWTTEAGEKKEEVTFVDVDFWGRTAETVSQCLRKGDPLLCEGRLKLNSWEDKQSGEKKQKLGITGESFSFLNKKAAPGGKASPAPAESAAPGSPEDGDDVPF